MVTSGVGVLLDLRSEAFFLTAPSALSGVFYLLDSSTTISDPLLFPVFFSLDPNYPSDDYNPHDSLNQRRISMTAVPHGSTYIMDLWAQALELGPCP